MAVMAGRSSPLRFSAYAMVASIIGDVPNSTWALRSSPMAAS